MRRLFATALVFLALFMAVCRANPALAQTWDDYRQEHRAWIERDEPPLPDLGVTATLLAARAEWQSVVRIRTARWYHRWQDVQAAELAGGVIVIAPGGIPDWYAIADCESGGGWATNSGNGFWGGLQFLPSTWFSFGGGPFDGVGPFPYSASEQIAVAERVLAAQGPSAWPNCFRWAP